MAQKCEDIMTKDPVCCSIDDTVDDVAQLMKDQDIGPVPVCESEGSRRLVGIVTDRDLVLKVLAENRDPEDTRVGDVMTGDPVTCKPENTLDEAADRMRMFQVRRVPIIDDSGRLVGIISQADIARSGLHQKTAEVVEEVSKPKVSAGGA